MKKILCLLLFFSLFVPALADEVALQAADKVLDDFHLAASQADGKRYFGHFTDNAVFLGTDLSERWNKEEFQAYALPYFSKGKGWTYHPKSRHLYLSPDGKTAWFDEVLENAKFGLTRGSGVLLLSKNGWKVAQYHLTLPVPNSLIETLVKMIEAETAQESTRP